jgi:hypothetical protein
MNEELQIVAVEIRLRPESVKWFIPLRLNECEVPDWSIRPRTDFPVVPLPGHVS